MRLLIILISLIGMILIGVEYFSFPLIVVIPLILFGKLILVIFLDTLIIKLPDSNEVKKWWRKNVVESTP